MVNYEAPRAESLELKIEYPVMSGGQGEGNIPDIPGEDG